MRKKESVKREGTTEQLALKCSEVASAFHLIVWKPVKIYLCGCLEEKGLFDQCSSCGPAAVLGQEACLTAIVAAMQSSNQRRESAGSAGPSESARTAGGSSAGPADEVEPTPPPPRAKPPAARPKRTVQEPDRDDKALYLHTQALHMLRTLYNVLVHTVISLQLFLFTLCCYVRNTYSSAAANIQQLTWFYVVLFIFYWMKFFFLFFLMMRISE